MGPALLHISGLQVAYPVGGAMVNVVDGVDLTLKRGRIIGIVGESGSGKTITAYSVLGLVDKPGRIMSGRIVFEDVDLLQLSEPEMQSIRGNRIAMILQDPTTALNPVLRIGTQMVEAITSHGQVDARTGWQRCVQALSRVGISNPDERMNAYPHELSGGMRQRVAIATAMLNGPDILIADEPTTALDVTIQAQILHEFQTLLEESQASALWISHDLSVVSSIADEIAVMYSGWIVEEGATGQVIHAPAHPYTRGLLDAFPDSRQPGEMLQQIKGMIGGLGNRPSGCPFRTRCPRATERCTAVPMREEVRSGQFVRCFYPLAPGEAA